MQTETHYKRSPRNGLLRQTLFWMTACAVGPLLIMAGQGYHCARQAILNLEATHLRSVLEARKARIEGWFSERERDIAVLATCGGGWHGSVLSVLETSRGAGESTTHFLDQFRKLSPSFESIVVFDERWHRIAAAVGSTEDDVELAPAEFRGEISESSRVAVMPPHLHGDEGIVIHLGTRIVATGDAPAGFLVASVRLSETLYPILEDRRGLRSTTKTYLVSSDGRFLSGPRPHIEVLSRGTRFPDGFLVEGLRPVETYIDCCGVRVLGVATAMPELGWTLVAEVYEKEAFMWLLSLRRRVVATAIVVVVAIVLVSLRGARSVARPFRELAAVARRVGAGNHEARVSQMGTAEAQDVGLAFNAMLDELAAKQGELADAAALAAVGKLSSAIVHEMRTPLGSVKLGLEAFAEQVADDPDYSELAQIAITQTERVQRMLSDLLAYAKPIPLDLQSVSLQSVLEEAVRLGRPSANHDGVDLASECADMEDGVVRIDREQMLRALGNLVLNALQASHCGGRVVVAARTADAAGREVAITVSDEGDGIPAAVQETVFDPFVSVREGGTGLGLATARKIVQGHGGRVTGENASSGGAVFTVFLPLCGDES